MQRACPIDGCQQLVRSERLMCIEHWALVPRPLARAVYDTWKQGAGRGTPAHRAACLAAIRAVYRALRQPVPEELESDWS